MDVKQLIPWHRTPAHEERVARILTLQQARRDEIDARQTALGGRPYLRLLDLHHDRADDDNYPTAA